MNAIRNMAIQATLKDLDDKQHSSIYADCEELVKVLTHRCKKLDGVE